MELEVFLGERRVGILAQAPGGDFSFTYDATWVADPERFALSPLPAVAPEPFHDIQDHVRDVGYRPGTPVEVGVKRIVDWSCEYCGYKR